MRATLPLNVLPRAVMLAAAEHGNRVLLHTSAFGLGVERIVSMGRFLLELTNVFIHVAASLLVFVLSRMIGRATPCAPAAAFVALGAGVLWLHPRADMGRTLIAPSIVGCLALRVQRLFILCATGATLASSEYSVLRAGWNLGTILGSALPSRSRDGSREGGGRAKSGT